LFIRCNFFKRRNGKILDVSNVNNTPFAVAKPLVVDGTSKSHELSLAYVEASLPLLDPPLVLQEFVNHGKHLIILPYILANYWSILKLILLSV